MNTFLPSSPILSIISSSQINPLCIVCMILIFYVMHVILALQLHGDNTAPCNCKVRIAILIVTRKNWFQFNKKLPMIKWLLSLWPNASLIRREYEVSHPHSRPLPTCPDPDTNCPQTTWAHLHQCTSVRIHPGPYPRHLKVPKHFIYIKWERRMQTVIMKSLNNGIME